MTNSNTHVQSSLQATKEAIPVTIICGFLGSGKTTLLKHILKTEHKYKIAVIENEFGEENIDNEILVNEGSPQIIQMSNGCICCNIRGDLQKALISLVEQRNSGAIYFDKVVIETTGVAEPGPVAQTFFLDQSVNVNYRLDAVITLVDAVHAMKHLNEHVQVQQQIGFADKIFITKCDLSNEKDIHKLTHRAIKINPRAKIEHLSFGNVELSKIFDLKGFNLDDKLEIDPHFLHVHEHSHTHNHEHKEHKHDDNCHDEHCTHEDHKHKHDHHHSHHHIDEIQSFAYRSQKPFVYEKLEQFLSGLLTVYGENLLRYKGVLYMQNVDRKVVLQGVHQIMGSDLGAMWIGKPSSKMVFIGTKLPKDIILQGLEMCIAE
jgi:G3E family GTPase